MLIFKINYLVNFMMKPKVMKNWSKIVNFTKSIKLWLSVFYTVIFMKKIC